MKVYLDNCCFNRPFDDQSQLLISLETQAKLQNQREIRQGDIELVSSYMLRYENGQNPFENRRLSTEEFIGKYSAEYIGIDKLNEITAKAKEIIKTGVKAKDAVHVAAAITAGCDCFISTDRRLLKYQSNEIKMLNPVDFIFLKENENDKQ